MKTLVMLLITLATVARGETHEGHGEHVDEVKLTADAIQRYDIKIAAVEKRALTPTLTVPARVAFNSEAIAHVGSAVHGRATEIKVRVGDHVNNGDELLIVESPELGEAQSDYLQKRTAVSVASSAVEPAKDAADRAKKLHEQNQGLALGEMQKRQADFKAAQGALQTAESAATAAQNKVQLLGMNQPAMDELVKSGKINPRFAIRAPLAGQVIEREVTLGELVSPDKEALLIIANVSTLWAIADVPENRLRDVSLKSSARVSVTAAATQPITGTVSFIAPTLDPNTRTSQVRIELSNASGDLKPGMFATAELLTTQRDPGEEVLAIPDAAVQTIEGGPAVFMPVEGEPNTFAKRAVTVGEPIGGMRAVLSGLKVGDRIVISGSFLLKAELGKSEAAHEH